jgi:hypothetical protein
MVEKTKQADTPVKKPRRARWVRICIIVLGVVLTLGLGGFAIWYTLQEPLMEDPLPLPQDFGLA